MKRNLEENIKTNLVISDLWINRIKQDCIDQKIFCAIRNNQLDFYHKGSRLFNFSSNGFKTHIKYASVIESNGNNYLTQDELKQYKLAADFISNYERIKENCSNYSGVEAKGVSEIYHRHSFMDRDKEIVVLDIEISIEAIDADKSQDRIDILLYNADERKLKFVEAKHYSNSEIWSKEDAKVINQIKRYESQIQLKKNEIVAEYNNYIEIANSMFSCKLPLITDIEEKVTLLVFGFDRDQQKGRLKELITNNEKFKDFRVYTKGNVSDIKLSQLWKA
jgi:hypothetical protein